MPALVWLNLSQNFIRKLPADFMNLQYLQHLNLSQNQLSKLQLSNLPSLAYLNVAGTSCCVYILKCESFGTNTLFCRKPIANPHREWSDWPAIAGSPAEQHQEGVAGRAQPEIPLSGMIFLNTASFHANSVKLYFIFRRTTS